MTNAEILERVIARLPYVQQMTNIDLTTKEGELRFDWRGTRYRVGAHFDVEEVRNSMLTGTDAALLMSALLKMVPR